MLTVKRSLVDARYRSYGNEQYFWVRPEKDIAHHHENVRSQQFRSFVNTATVTEKRGRLDALVSQMLHSVLFLP